MAHLLALDQGTTSSRAILFDERGEILGVEQQEFTQIFPKSGWVEHDPQEIWSSQREVLERLLKATGIATAQIEAIGIDQVRPLGLDPDPGLAGVVTDAESAA